MDTVEVDSVEVDSAPQDHNLGPMPRHKASTKEAEEVSVDQAPRLMRMPRHNHLIKAVASMGDLEGLDQLPQLMLRRRALTNKDQVVLEVGLEALEALRLLTPTHKPLLDFDVVRSWTTKIKTFTL